MSGRRPTWIAVAALATAILHPLALAAAVRTDEAFNIAFTPATIPYALVGLLIVRADPSNRVGRLFVLVGVLVPASILGSSAAILDLPGAIWAAWLSSVVGPLMISILLIFLPLLFPTGRFMSRRWRWFGGAALLFLVGTLPALAFEPELGCCEGVSNPLWVPALDPITKYLDASFVVLAAMALVALGSLVVRLLRARGEERLQLKWIAFGVACLVVPVALASAASAVFPELQTELSELGPVVPVTVAGGSAAIALSVGVAVLRYRLYEIDVIIRRTLVYGLLTVVLVSVYGAAILLLQLALSPLTGGDSLAVAVSTLMAVALFQPLRRRIQTAVDRRFYRSRYDAQRTIEVFGARLRDEVELARLTDELSGTVHETLQPAAVSVWLRVPSGRAR